MVRLFESTLAVFRANLQQYLEQGEIYTETVLERTRARNLVSVLLGDETTIAVINHEELTNAILDSGHDGESTPHTWHPDYGYQLL